MFWQQGAIFREFINNEGLFFYDERRVISTQSTCWTYDHLLLINSLKMAPWCQTCNSWYLIWSFFDLFYCIVISAFCWLGYGMLRNWRYEWHKKMCLYVIHGSEFEEESVWLFSKYLHGLFKICTISWEWYSTDTKSYWFICFLLE